jgi:hypothetical protein
MNEAPENPYQASPIVPDRAKSGSTWLRRVVGVLALLIAVYFSILWLVAIVIVAWSRALGEFRIGPFADRIVYVNVDDGPTQAAWLALPIALASGWAAWKFLTRRTGTREWLALVMSIAIIAAGELLFP